MLSLSNKWLHRSRWRWRMRWPFKEIDALKDKLRWRKLYLEEEIRTEFNFEEIIERAHR